MLRAAWCCCVCPCRCAIPARRGVSEGGRVLRAACACARAARLPSFRWSRHHPLYSTREMSLSMSSEAAVCCVKIENTPNEDLAP